MIGLSWRGARYGSSIRVDKNGELVRIGPGEGGDTSHGPRADRLITRIGDDPIHAGMPKVWLTPDSEVCVYARGPAERVRCSPTPRTLCRDGACCGLWNGQPPTAKAAFMFSVYGHVWPGDVHPAGMRCGAVQTIIPRVLQWLVGRQETFPVPKDFPGIAAVSVRKKSRSSRFLGTTPHLCADNELGCAGFKQHETWRQVTRFQSPCRLVGMYLFSVSDPDTRSRRLRASRRCTLINDITGMEKLAKLNRCAYGRAKAT